ncbi:hypothetical protein LINPERPRIM_LOCUS38645 [Linum perenne]
MRKFSVTLVWNTIRARTVIVHWYNLFWKHPAIPEHIVSFRGFQFWLSWLPERSL